MTRLLTTLSCAVLALLCWAGTGQAQPLGPSHWLNPEGKISRSLPAVELAWDSAGQWTWIQDDFTQIGQKQAWQTRSGPWRLRVDSVGNVLLSIGDHHLGFEAPYLLKFDGRDSTFEVLATFNPDTAYAADNRIVFPNAFGITGIDVVVNSNQKVIREVSPYEYRFTQAGRDALAAMTPWANRYIGTATKLVTDSLRAKVRFDDADIEWTSLGRIIDGPVRITTAANEHLVWIKDEYIRCDTGLTNVRVRKQLIQRADNSRWMLELFSATQVAALPAGTIRHTATFGRTSGTAGFSIAIEGIIKGNVESNNVPASNGTTDSVVAYMTVSQDHSVTCGLFENPASLILVACGTPRTFNNAASARWEWFAMPGGGVVAGSVYLPMVWANVAAGTCEMSMLASTNDSVFTKTVTYSAGSCPDPLVTPGYTNGYAYLLYVVYTESGGAPTGQVIMIGGD